MKEISRIKNVGKKSHGRKGSEVKVMSRKMGSAVKKRTMNKREMKTAE